MENFLYQFQVLKSFHKSLYCSKYQYRSPPYNTFIVLKWHEFKNKTKEIEKKYKWPIKRQCEVWRPLELIKHMISDSPCRKQHRRGGCEKTETKEVGGCLKTKGSNLFSMKNFTDFLANFCTLAPPIGMSVKDCGQIHRFVQYPNHLNQSLFFVTKISIIFLTRQ